MTHADINKAVRALSYLGAPDTVRAGVCNTYGVDVALERVQRILKQKNAERAYRAVPEEPKDSDGWHYDVRISQNARVQRAEPIAVRDRPAFRERAPLPTSVPKPTANPFEGPFQFNVLAASVGKDFGIGPADIRGKGRFRHLVLARVVMTKLCIEQGMSCCAIGNKMGDRDHTTILNQRDIFDAYAAKYPVVRLSYERHVALRAAAAAARSGGGE